MNNLQILWAVFCDDLANLRRRIWNKHLKLWWYRLYIRRDEFHRSLDADFDAMVVMDDLELTEYFRDLYRRRRIAHRRDINRRMRKGIMSILNHNRGTKS